MSGGGDDGIRTHDPLLAGQVLSQLSYTPMGYILLGFDQSLKIEQQSLFLSTNSTSFGFSTNPNFFETSFGYLTFSIERR